MYKRGFPGLAILVAMTFASSAMASEPDGRIAFRYEWLDKVDADAATPKLRVTLTAVVGLTETQLKATLPAGIDLTVNALGRAPAPWPEDGMAIGDLAAGQTIVVDLDVAKPEVGGGIVEFTLEAIIDGRVVRERVGVPVGLPGVAPTLRNGALEFPASHEVPGP